ncbi:hypothetical protein SI65_02319 [Aspergillus cristatus]|uniref:F-box domain-containing protein n=1 Tax=Aspergillus cristatus TaxID=573508 RepID=A0A1E3BKI6_ASPCR|nr:hypothetical protein SI65_02319 [Aspergillus cristatus]
MHERCWVLMTRVLDVDLIEEHLDLFVRALCHQAKRNEFEPDDSLADDYPELWGQLDKFYHRSKEYLRIHKNGQHPYRGCCEPPDPLNIPELRDLLRHPEKIRRETRNSKTQIIPYTHSRSRTSNIAVPMDVVLMIIDLLPGRRNIKLLLLVFPQWSTLIPQIYWRLRCIHDHFLPEESLPAVDELDWRWFYFNFDQMLSKSLGWLNRRRVMRDMEHIDMLFLTILARSK